jgi:transposase InsO family protein
VNAKRVQRIWRQEGLKVPHKQPKRGRLWLNDGSCVRLRAERPNHVWSYDFVEDRTHDGRKFRMLCLIDEFTHEALAIRVKRRLNSTDVLETLADVMILRGPPAYVRSDNVQFTFPPRYADGPTARYMTHMFDMRCEENGIEHRLTKVKHPWTNGQVERMNRTIKEATVKRYHYDSHQQLEAHLSVFIDAYNYGRRLKTLKGLTPYEFICKMWTKEPKRFKLNPIHQSPGLNT